MKQNEQFSYSDEKDLIMDDALVEQDYSTVQKAIAGAMAAIGVTLVLTFFKSAKARHLAKKQAKKLAHLYR